MSWEQLMTYISEMSESQKQSDASIMIDGEVYKVDALLFAEEADVLDKDHPYLVLSV